MINLAAVYAKYRRFDADRRCRAAKLGSCLLGLFLSGSVTGCWISLFVPLPRTASAASLVRVPDALPLIASHPSFGCAPQSQHASATAYVCLFLFAEIFAAGTYPYSNACVALVTFYCNRGVAFYCCNTDIWDMA